VRGAGALSYRGRCGQVRCQMLEVRSVESGTLAFLAALAVVLGERSDCVELAEEVLAVVFLRNAGRGSAVLDGQCRVYRPDCSTSAGNSGANAARLRISSAVADESTE